jgi:hypothetical protein
MPLPDNLLNLTDAELSVIMAAATPLEPQRRNEFLQEIATTLTNGHGELGVGSIYRIVRDIQRKYFDASNVVGGYTSAPKYARRSHERHRTDANLPRREDLRERHRR